MRQNSQGCESGKLSIFIATLLLIVTFCVSDGFAVNCFQSDIVLNTQDEIDNFQDVYGGDETCDTVTSDLTVLLSPVSNLDEITESPWGTLTINFDDCQNATATLDGVDGQQTMNMVKLAGLQGSELNCN